MKKALIILTVFLASFANAQKGTYLVSGNLNYYIQSNNQQGPYDYTNLGISPKVGYQFSEKWTVGGEMGIYYNSQKWNQGYTSEYKNNNFSVGGFVRYSKPLTETFSLFADFGLGYTHRNEYTRNVDGDLTTKYDGFYSQFQPLLFLKVKNNFGINFGLGGFSFNSINNKTSNNSQNTFSFNFGQAFTLGVQKNF